MKTAVPLALLLFSCFPSLVAAEDPQVLSELNRLSNQINSLIAKREKDGDTQNVVADAD